MNDHRIVKLTPPRISAEHIDRKITCLRAHRERIFRVSTELVGGKLICHNYGQGGAGWTFLFGCVHESIRQFEEQLALDPSFKDKPITVIGAGCYGLLTALLLTRKGYAVRIVAKETDNLTSDAAAGFFFPRTRKRATPEEQAIFETLSTESYRTYLEIAHGIHPFITQGPKLLPSYFDPEISPGLDKQIELGLVNAPELVFIDFGNGKQYRAMEYTMIYINPSAMMKELRRHASTHAIPIVRAHVGSFDDVAESIIFNCAGLGAKELTDDSRLIPVQGHLITLKDQPDPSFLQYLINVKIASTTPQGIPRDEFIYYAPKENGILGITFLRGHKALTANDHEFDRLIQRARDFFG
jgi:hypothetical protein